MAGSEPEFGKVVIFGVGLIGGSFALALKQAEQVGEVVGFGRTLATLTQALELGLIDRVGANPGHEVADADLVLIATPVGQMAEIMERIAPYLGEQTIVTDGGSTKSDVVAVARAVLGDRVSQFVPAHPIAGAENSGAAAARPDLYRDKKVVLTPLPENASRAKWMPSESRSGRMPNPNAAQRVQSDACRRPRSSTGPRRPPGSPVRLHNAAPSTPWTRVSTAGSAYRGASRVLR